MDFTKIAMKNMVFYGHHGVFAAEKELGQKIEVDLVLEGNFLTAGKNDDLDRTVNYRDVYLIVKEIMAEKKYNLIEGIAIAIADRIAAGFDLDRITVRVRKPQPPVGGLIESVEFEFIKERG